MDCSFGTEQSVSNRSRYDPKEDHWRSDSPSVNNDRDSRIGGDESEKDCKSLAFCLNPSSPSRDVPPEFEKVFVKVENVSASDEELDEQKFWIEEPCVGQEPQAGCSSWSDEVDHQRGRDLDSTTAKGKGGSHQHKEFAEDRSGACGSPVTNDPDADIYCVGSDKVCRNSIPSSNAIILNNILTIDEEYLSIPVEVIDEEIKTSTMKQKVVATRSEQSIAQNSNKNMLTIENYVCEICNFETPSSRIFKGHMMTKHSDQKPFHCKFCDFKCSRSFHLKGHEKTHTGEKPFNCKFCDYKCSRSSSLKVHERLHTGEKPFHCKFCDYVSSERSHLKRHERIHTDVYPLHCRICDYKCSQRSNLKTHQRTHTGEKPFQCEFCDFKCSRSSSLKCHLRVHTGEYPFHCKLCDYKCSQHYNLKVHQRTHTGEKPFNCKFCNYKCSQLPPLKVHERIHTGEKPYHCEFCDYKCSNSSQLKYHIKTHTSKST